MYKREQKCCAHCRREPDENLLIDGQLPYVKKCLTEPSGIIWQNMHITWKTRWMRMVCQVIVLALLLVGGFLFLSFLNIASPSIETTTQDISQYDFAAIQKTTDDALIQKWCLNEQNPSQAVQQFCEDDLFDYYGRIGSTIGISLSVVVVKILMKQIVVLIAHFQRYKDHTQLSRNIMVNLMITYICTTILITFLVISI